MADARCQRTTKSANGIGLPIKPEHSALPLLETTELPTKLRWRLPWAT